MTNGPSFVGSPSSTAIFAPAGNDGGPGFHSIDSGALNPSEAGAVSAETCPANRVRGSPMAKLAINAGVIKVFMQNCLPLCSGVQVRSRCDLQSSARTSNETGLGQKNSRYCFAVST